VLPRRAAAAGDERTRALLWGLRGAVLGRHRARERPRCAPQNARELRLAPLERALLEAALGGPLDGGGFGADAARLLGVELSVCRDADQQAACLIDLAGAPDVLVRAYVGLMTWV